MSILISIVITNYNKSRFIRHSIESALAQQLHEHQFEVVVVDDCSTDDSVGEIHRFAGQVRVVQNGRNSGALISTLAGCRHAKGTYILTLDGDDILAPGVLGSIESSGLLRPDVALRGRIVRTTTPEETQVDAIGCPVGALFAPAYRMALQRKTGGSSLVFPRKTLLRNLEWFPPITVQDHTIPEIISFDLAEFILLGSVTHFARTDDSIEQISRHNEQLHHDKMLSSLAVLRKAVSSRLPSRRHVRVLQRRACFRCLRGMVSFGVIEARTCLNLAFGLINVDRLDRACVRITSSMRRKFPDIRHYELEMREFIGAQATVEDDRRAA